MLFVSIDLLLLKYYLSIKISYTNITLILNIRYCYERTLYGLHEIIAMTIFLCYSLPLLLACTAA